MRKADDWKPHAGMQDPPLRGDTHVEVMFRDGDTLTGTVHDWDQNWQWSEDDEMHDGDIVAYRVLPV